MSYINTGQCIWCGKRSPEVSFVNKPHVIPDSLGGEDIGTDICDECNLYFGKAEKGLPNMDLVFKEVFNITRLIREPLDENTYKKLHSVFFRYYHKERKFVIKPAFNKRIITRQFKRSLFEVFLQMYHKETGDGNNPKFAAIRDFARYNKGDLRVFYAFNNVVLAPDFTQTPKLPMSQKLIADMNGSGVFLFWFLSHPLYLEVFPTVFNVYGFDYLKKEAETMIIHAKGNEGIFELRDIMQMDFFMQRFNEG